MLSVKARQLERQRLTEVSEWRTKQEEEDVLRSVYQQLSLSPDGASPQSAAEAVTDRGEERGPIASDEGRLLQLLPRLTHDRQAEQPSVINAQRQKRREKEKQWRRSVEDSRQPYPGDEEFERERRLIEVEQRQRRLAKQEHWRRCTEEEVDRRAREARERKEAWRQAEQELMEKEEEEQKKRLVVEQQNA